MSPSPLIAPESLAGLLDEPGVVIIEVSFLEPERAAYRDAHVPGAHYAYWKDLLWHATRRDFAPASVLAERLAGFGVGEGTTLVLMGDRVQMSTYAYWVLTMSGLAEGVRVLDGARGTWEARGLPLESGAVAPVAPRRAKEPRRGDVTSRIGRDEVLEGLGDPRRVIVDLRSNEEYSGRRVAPLSSPYDHGAERAGHIPGARSLPHEELLESDGVFRSPEELAQRFEGVGVLEDRHVVTTCRLGHRAALGWFVLSQLVQRPGVRVYDGSWTEWGSIVGAPIER